MVLQEQGQRTFSHGTLPRTIRNNKLGFLPLFLTHIQNVHVTIRRYFHLINSAYFEAGWSIFLQTTDILINLVMNIICLPNVLLLIVAQLDVQGVPSLRIKVCMFP